MRYLERVEQARARDHRRLGTQLDLYHLSDHAPGMPFWHPKGMVIWNALEDLRRRENLKRGYVEVKTPLLFDIETCETSGHYQKYRENMFFVQGEEDEQPLALKPMNCPGHMLLFGSALRSYRDLPLRYAEASTLHRDELGGTLHGLLRVKHVTQDDAHIFITEEQIQDEIDAIVDYTRFLYGLFGVEARAELSTRPEQRLGTDEQWDHAESALRGSAEAARDGLRHLAGRGRLLRAEDRPAHGGHPRPLLADGDDPARLPDAGAVRPDLHGRRQPGAHAVVIHRALLGSLERFIGILIEHYAGAFPFWLAPVQIRILPVGEGHRAAAHELAARLEPYRVEVDERDETVGKRIRDAELEKIPVTIVYGDKESDDSLAVRERGGEQFTKSLDDFAPTLLPCSLQAGAPRSSPPELELRRFNRVGRTRIRAALAAAFVSPTRREPRTW